MLHFPHLPVGGALPRKVQPAGCRRKRLAERDTTEKHLDQKNELTGPQIYGLTRPAAALPQSGARNFVT